MDSFKLFTALVISILSVYPFFYGSARLLLISLSVEDVFNMVCLSAAMVSDICIFIYVNELLYLRVIISRILFILLN